MKLILVGAGEVGRELIKRLQKDWQITVIDEDEDKLKRIIEIADILYSLRVISDYKKNRIDSESIEEIGEYINFCFNLLNQIEEKR